MPVRSSGLPDCWRIAVAADLPVGDVRRGPTCFACEHAMGVDVATGEAMIRERHFARGPTLHPVVIRPVCMKHGIAFSAACRDFEPVKDTGGA